MFISRKLFTIIGVVKPETHRAGQQDRNSQRVSMMQSKAELLLPLDTSAYVLKAFN